MTPQDFSPEDLITARLIELVDKRTPWNRSLWQLGTLLCLREVLEYAEGVRTGAMKIEGLAHVTDSARGMVARDVGLGTDDVRKELADLLGKIGTKPGAFDPSLAASLDQLTRRCESGYVRGWSAFLARGEVSFDHVEIFARSVVSHLLDAGFSGDHLHGWLLASRDRGNTLADLLAKADEMCRRAPAEYEVLVPFTVLPPELADAAGPRHLTWEAMTARLEIEKIAGPPGRQGAGALTFVTAAREPKAAIAAVEIELRRLAARVVIGLSTKTVQPVGHVLVLNGQRPKWTPLRSRTNEILVSSIVRHGLLLPVARGETNTPLDDAFELLAAVETSTSWASVAAIWAAVEGLLARPGESGPAAADRMAAVVAGGFVRAELTQLVEAVALDPTWEERLGPASALTQPQKLDALMSAVQEGKIDFSTSAADAAAAARIRTLAVDPAGVMRRVIGYYKDAFRRLFNQRNLLLHGGRFDSVALPATMRTVPHLVAAGIDRIVHAAMEDGPTSPVALAARADNEIRLLGLPGARPVHRLLD